MSLRPMRRLADVAAQSSAVARRFASGISKADIIIVGGGHNALASAPAGLIITGPTGTNVADITIALRGVPSSSSSSIATRAALS